jgi:hypothetical protein
VHDNKSVAQSSNTNTPNPISNYLAVPGTGEVLAFGSTAGGTTNTHPGWAGLGDWAGKFGKSVTDSVHFTIRSATRSRSGRRARIPTCSPAWSTTPRVFITLGNLLQPEPRPAATAGNSDRWPRRDKRFGSFSPGLGRGLGGIEDTAANGAVNLAIGGLSGLSSFFAGLLFGPIFRS